MPQANQKTMVSVRSFQQLNQLLGLPEKPIKAKKPNKKPVIKVKGKLKSK